jgi:hypothetical protein
LWNGNRMGEYQTMRAIRLKNEILTPTIVKAYLAGKLDYQTFQCEFSPFQEYYANSYKYIDYPNIDPKLMEQVQLVKPLTLIPAGQGKSSPNPIPAPVIRQ